MNILLIGATLALATTITVLQRQSPYSPARKKPTPTPTATATPTPTPTPLPSPSPSPSPLAPLAIYTANLSHGQGTDNLFDYARQAVALSTADIVAAQEASAGDLPIWDAAFAQQGMTRAIYFPNAPNGNNDGQAIWYRPSAVTITATFTHQLSSGFIGWDGSTVVDNSAVAVRMTAGARQFVLVDTHLCFSRCADAQGSTYSAQRVAQINELLSWINTTFPGEDILIAGDMNFSPTYPKAPSGYQIDLFTEAGFADLWQVGVGAGVAHSDWGDRDGDGAADMPVGNIRTADKRRIDYFFARGTLTMQRIDLPDSRLPCPQALVFEGLFAQCSPTVVKLWDVPDDQGVRLSDHNWLKLTL